MQRQRERHRLRNRLQARMRRVAEEARRWTALVESKVAAGTIICDHQPVHPTLATLTGRRSRFLIKSKNVTFGRLSSSFSPDIDLTCEGEALRISRCHGQIYLGNKGDFWLRNFSKHPVFVDGNPVLKGWSHCPTASLSSTFICFKNLLCEVTELFLPPTGRFVE
ncbi:unnamed protein product [Dibothriocephalus latus]|uniref:FHA domain-containing protein n=1 Tax=Dibothriocephalus latus TaxID=60516 RepID=A0A3P7PUE6_DIBLA|nr:unnamed protein product [Dibothriocephalus latus]